jgi:hypothetical protein
MNELIQRVGSGQFKNPFLQGAERAKQAGHLDYDELQIERGKKIAAGRTSLGAANYSWANPLAMRVKLNSYNAKNLPFSEAGIGLSNYGWNEDNIFQQLETARRNYRSGDKTGGHHDVYKYMLDQLGTFSDPKQAQLMKQFMETGNVPSGLTMDTVMQVSDYGLRANARKQQRKKKGFLGGNIGAIIGTIGGAIIGCFAGPGGCAAGAKMGAAAGGAAGGAGQAINEDRGLLGTALATWSGYGIGSLAGNVATAATTGAQQAAVEGGKQAALEGTRKAGESALIEAAKQKGLSWAINPVTGAVINVAEQGVRSLAGSLAAPFKAAAAPLDTVNNLWNTIQNPLQTFQGTGFYQGAVQPWVKAGQGLYGGIGSLAQGQPFGAGFTAGSGGYFSGPAVGGPALTSQYHDFPEPDFQRKDIVPAKYDVGRLQQDALMGPVQPEDYVTSYFDPNAASIGFEEGGRGVAENIVSDMGGAGAVGGLPDYPIGTYNPGAAMLDIDPATALASPAATTGPFSLPTALYAQGAVKQILDPVTPEEYAEDKGFFTEGNISRDMLNLDEEGIGSGEGPQLGGYDFEGVGQPGAYVPSEGYASRSRRQLPGYERGALGRRVFGGAPITLQNQFDLSPYFQTPVFKKGGAVGSCASGNCACPSCYEAGGAVDAGQHKGFPFMEQLPTGMQSKFQAYESGTQSITDSSGEQLEEGYRRVSGSGMEPVEERYVRTPMGIQEFFSRTPNGQFRLRV